MATKEKHKPK